MGFVDVVTQILTYVDFCDLSAVVILGGDDFLPLISTTMWRQICFLNSVDLWPRVGARLASPSGLARLKSLKTGEELRSDFFAIQQLSSFRYLRHTNVDSIDIKYSPMHAKSVYLFNPTHNLIAMTFKKMTNAILSVYAFGEESKKNSGQDVYHYRSSNSYSHISLSWSHNGTYLLAIERLDGATNTTAKLKLFQYFPSVGVMRCLAGSEFKFLVRSSQLHHNPWISDTEFVIPNYLDTENKWEIKLITLKNKSFSEKILASHKYVRPESHLLRGCLMGCTKNMKDKLMFYIEDCLKPSHSHHLIFIQRVTGSKPCSVIIVPGIVVEMNIVQGKLFFIYKTNEYYKYDAEVSASFYPTKYLDNHPGNGTRRSYCTLDNPWILKLQQTNKLNEFYKIVAYDFTEPTVRPRCLKLGQMQAYTGYTRNTYDFYQNKIKFMDNNSESKIIDPKIGTKGLDCVGAKQETHLIGRSIVYFNSGPINTQNINSGSAFHLNYNTGLCVYEILVPHPEKPLYLSTNYNDVIQIKLSDNATNEDRKRYPNQSGSIEYTKSAKMRKIENTN